jgi:hypothetical protein
MELYPQKSFKMNEKKAISKSFKTIQVVIPKFCINLDHVITTLPSEQSIGRAEVVECQVDN